jgi:hypothetical protein
MIEAAVRCGKIQPDGLRVKVAWGTLEVKAKVARQTLAKSLARLEDRGFHYRDNADRKRDETGAFVLRAKVDQEGSTGAGEEKETPELQRYGPGSLPLRALPGVPRLRYSRPKWKPSKKMIREHRLGTRSVLPEPREHIARLGKIRGAVVDALVTVGGSCMLAELCAALNHERTRDVKRRVLPMLEAAMVIETVEDGVVTLTPDWSERLGRAREVGGEFEADDLAEARRTRKSRAYRDRDKPLCSKPSPEGLAALRRGKEKRAQNLAAHEEHEAKAAAARAAEFERVRGKALEAFRARSSGARINLALAVGGELQDVEALAKSVLAYHRVPVARWDRVWKRVREPVLAAAAIIAREAKPAPGEPVEDWRSHPLSCECQDCSASDPKYATGVA